MWLDMIVELLRRTETAESGPQLKVILSRILHILMAFA